MSEESELLILLMNTMKSDLHSDNYLVVCASLDTVCHLATEDALPLIVPSIRELLTHNKELVRKKAVMALHRFYQKAPHLLDDYGALCRKVRTEGPPRGPRFDPRPQHWILADTFPYFFSIYLIRCCVTTTPV